MRRTIAIISAILVLLVMAPYTIHVYGQPTIRYIAYRIMGTYKCLGRGEIIGQGSFNILVNLTIYSYMLLEMTQQNETMTTITPRFKDTMIVDVRYAETGIKIKGDTFILEQVSHLLITPGRRTYTNPRSWEPLTSLYQGLIAIYIPPQILRMLIDNVIYNKTASWLIKIVQNTKAYIVETDNIYEATVTVSNKHFYLRTIQQYYRQGWLRRAQIYIVTSINIPPSQLPFIYWKTIQATLIVQAQVKAEQSNIIGIPPNPAQTLQQYSGLILITAIALTIILIKKKLIPYLRKRICQT